MQSVFFYKYRGTKSKLGVGTVMAMFCLRFLVAGLFHDLMHSFHDRGNAKFLGCTFLPWNGDKEALPFRKYLASNFPVGLKTHFQ